MAMSYIVYRYKAKNEHQFDSNEILYLSFILFFIGILVNCACILQMYALIEYIFHLHQAILFLHILFKLVQYLILINRLNICYIVKYSRNRLIFSSIISTILSFVSIALFATKIDRFFGFVLIIVYDTIIGFILIYFYFKPYYLISSTIKYRGDQQIAQILLQVSRKQLILICIMIIITIFGTIYYFSGPSTLSPIWLILDIFISMFCVFQS